MSRAQCRGRVRHATREMAEYSLSLAAERDLNPQPTSRRTGSPTAERLKRQISSRVRCSRSSPSYHCMMSSILAPVSRFSKMADNWPLERERLHAPQHFPVGFRNGAWHGVDSVIVEAERE